MIKKILLTTLLSLLSSISILAQLDMSKSQLEIEHISGNVYLFVQKSNISNPSSVVYISEERSVLIDPGFQQMQKLIRDSISVRHGGDIEFVMATHFHTDHAQSMEMYYENTSVLLSTVQYNELTNTLDSDNLISTGKLYSKLLGDEELHIHTMPFSAGHTGMDALFFFCNANVLVVGDYLFQNMYPIIDVKKGGDIEGYFKNIDFILQIANEHTKIIPGHTSFQSVEHPYLTKEEYRLHIQNLKETIEIVRSMKHEGLTEEQAIEQGLPAPYSYFDEGTKFVSEERWISFLYENL